MKYYNLMAAYGMNTNLAQMASRCPNAISIGRLDIPDHRLVFRGVADIEESYGDTLQTVLWDITPMCEMALDRLEGYPNFYTKKYVDVEIEGVEYTIMLYQMTYNYVRDYTHPSMYYEEMLEEGYKEHGLDLDQIYNAKGYNKEHDTLDYIGRNYYNRYSY